MVHYEVYLWMKYPKVWVEFRGEHWTIFLVPYWNRRYHEWEVVPVLV